MGCAWFKLKLPCFKSSSLSLQESSVKQYSWDKKAVMQKEDYLLENLIGQTVIKEADSIKGQQFIIQNCKDCRILLLDHTSSVTIDDCSSCFIFVAPVKTSCFVRDCTDCQLVAACQQFRSRDCKRLQIHLCCTSQPSIEASSNLSFQCYQCHYPLIAEHFSKAFLNEYNNNWSNIHDFTPTSHHSLNFSFLPLEASYEANLQNLPANLDITATSQNSFVPFTHALQTTLYQESCLVILHKNVSHKSIVTIFLNLAKQEGCVLARSRELECNKMNSDRLFNYTPPPVLPTNGSMVCLEMVGEDASIKSSSAIDKAKDLVQSGVGVGDGESGYSKGLHIGSLQERQDSNAKAAQIQFVAHVTDAKSSPDIINNFHAIIKSQMGF